MTFWLYFGTCPCRSTLHGLANRERRKSSLRSKHTNYRYLSTPEKIPRLRDDRNKIRAMEKRIKTKLAGIPVCTLEALEDTYSDLQQVMVDEQAIVEKLPEDYFQSIFWKQPKEAMATHKNGMLRHPLMIRWCLYLRHLSSKAYETIRDSGCN